jgi:SAM-dependent methyltransferase
VEWTPGCVRSFWGTFESQSGNRNYHFGRQRGAAVLRYAARHNAVAGPVLDLGCGPGYLLDNVSRRRIPCAGADIVPGSLSVARARLRGFPAFLGVVLIAPDGRLPFADSSFNTVFLLETIEHLTDEECGGLHREVLRVLGPGGSLIVTTPNNEDLSAHFVKCPACGRSFHRVQHVRSFTRTALEKTIAGHGYRVPVCSAAPLLPEPKVWIMSQLELRGVKVFCPGCGKVFAVPGAGVWQRVRDLFGELSHLICIARKPA